MKNQEQKVKNLKIVAWATISAFSIVADLKGEDLDSNMSIVYTKAAIIELRYPDCDIELVMQLFLAAAKAGIPKHEKFPPGGVRSNTPPGGITSIAQPEFMHRVETALATGKTYPTLVALEDECAKCCAVQPEWEADFKKIRRTFYSEERSKNGADILQEIRRRLLAVQTEAAKRLLDKALDLQ